MESTNLKYTSVWLQLFRQVLIGSVLAVGLVALNACGAQSSQATTPQSFISITSDATPRYIGEVAEVCGSVVDTYYASNSNGSPTFLNFDRPYPDHTFVVLIWGDDRGNLPANPEFYYLNKSVCVTGLIESYRGQAEITLRTPEQIRLDN